MTRRATSSRRSFLKTGLAATAAVAAPGRLTAQSAPPAAKTIRAVMQGDLPCSTRSGPPRTSPPITAR